MSSTQVGDKLTIETPEQMTVDFALAGIGSRFLALVIDSFLQGVITAILVFGLGIAGIGAATMFGGGGNWFVAAMFLGMFVVNFGYFAVFEAVWRGQTPGKRYMKLRVIKDSGRPITAAEAVARNLLRIVDQLPAIYGIGIVSVLLSKQNKRLGDFVAGTVVVHEQPLAEAPAPWQPSTEMQHSAYQAARLSPEELTLIETFLDRRASLEIGLRQSTASRIASRLGEKLGVPADQRRDDETFLEALAHEYRAVGRAR